MKAVLIVALLAVVPASLLAVEPAEFKTLMASISERDYEPVDAFLEERRATSQKDPEYFVLLLNFVHSKGERSGIVVAQGEPGPGDLALQDRSSGETVGFLGTRSELDEDLILDGISRTQSALPHFPERLDIRFGLVTVAERIKRWDLVGAQLVEMLRVSREIDNRWVWGPVGSMSGDPQDFMIQNILPRTSAFFHADDAAADDTLILVSKAMIEHYPELVYGYSNLGTLHLAKGEYRKSRPYLERAIEIDPTDEIVRSNLAKLDQARD